MHKIQRMDPTIGRPSCLTCNRGNTPDDPDSMEEFWVLDLERDVNWGDPAYICKYCCEKIAAVSEYVPEDQLEQARATIKEKNKRIHDLEAALDSLRRRFRTASAGSKALKSAKKQVA